MVNVVVPLMSFRNALKAVAAHSPSSVLFAPGADLQLAAADGYSAAVAVVPIMDREDGDAEPFRLRVTDLQAVLAVFKPPRDKTMASAAMLRLRLDRPPRPGDEDLPDQDVTEAGPREGDATDEVFGDRVITSADQLFATRELRLPAEEQSGALDVRAIVAGLLGAPDDEGGTDIGLSASSLADLRTASQALGKIPFIRIARGSTSPILIATVGPDFIGAYTTSRPPGYDQDVPEPAGHRDVWAGRLRGLTLADEAEEFLEAAAEQFAAALRELIGDTTSDCTDDDSADPMDGQEAFDLEDPEYDSTDEVGGWPVRRPKTIHEDNQED